MWPQQAGKAGVNAGKAAVGLLDSWVTAGFRCNGEMDDTFLVGSCEDQEA